MSLALCKNVRLQELECVMRRIGPPSSTRGIKEISLAAAYQTVSRRKAGIHQAVMTTTDASAMQSAIQNSGKTVYEYISTVGG